MDIFHVAYVTVYLDGISNDTVLLYVSELVSVFLHDAIVLVLSASVQVLNLLAEPARKSIIILYYLILYLLHVYISAIIDYPSSNIIIYAMNFY